MASTKSKHSPIVRDGLCRHIRNKGMIIHMDEVPGTTSQGNYLAVDKHALPWDGTTWWCTQTSKTVGADDRPCDPARCKQGRSCFEAEGDDRVA